MHSYLPKVSVFGVSKYAFQILAMTVPHVPHAEIYQGRIKAQAGKPVTDADLLLQENPTSSLSARQGGCCYAATCHTGNPCRTIAPTPFRLGAPLPLWKETKGWAAPKIQSTQAVGHWRRLLLATNTQLRLAPTWPLTCAGRGKGPYRPRG